MILSVVDQSPLRAGGTAADALKETVRLAQRCEALGYERYWVAEHHNSTNFAGTAPEILIGQIAANTDRIRVGSAGVMLTHYSSLKVAEQFRILSAFYPGRIDLGIGRAPGSDQRTAFALVHPKPMANVEYFPRMVQDLMAFLEDRIPEGHDFAGIRAQPGPSMEGAPEVWLLGSSDYSAQLAALLGLPFAFADFFGYASAHGPEVAAMYREGFKASEYLKEPKMNVTLQVLCAETDERARFIGSSKRLQVAQSRTGHRRQPLLAPEEAYEVVTNPEAESIIGQYTGHIIEGSPETVKAAILEAGEKYGTTDIGIATTPYGYEDRVRSYELLAEVFELH
jgi:luciferase family oxidoreductase group 1